MDTPKPLPPAKPGDPQDNPIYLAVYPLVVDAKKQARQNVILLAIGTAAALSSGRKFDEVYHAPPLRPTAECDSMMIAILGRQRALAMSITKPAGFPGSRIVCPEAVDNLIRAEEQHAKIRYEDYIWKLINKIGATTSAKLEGNHVWQHSILRVVKADGTAESWLTQNIINHSKHGTPFNQWPTRKLKPGEVFVPKPGKTDAVLSTPPA